MLRICYYVVEINLLTYLLTYIEERCVCTSRLGLVGDPMTPCDVIPVYTMMNENFKGGLNNVMPMNKERPGR